MGAATRGGDMIKGVALRRLLEMKNFDLEVSNCFDKPKDVKLREIKRVQSVYYTRFNKVLYESDGTRGGLRLVNTQKTHTRVNSPEFVIGNVGNVTHGPLLNKAMEALDHEHSDFDPIYTRMTKFDSSKLMGTIARGLNFRDNVWGSFTLEALGYLYAERAHYRNLNNTVCKIDVAEDAKTGFRSFSVSGGSIGGKSFEVIYGDEIFNHMAYLSNRGDKQIFVSRNDTAIKVLDDLYAVWALGTSDMNIAGDKTTILVPRVDKSTVEKELHNMGLPWFPRHLQTTQKDENLGKLDVWINYIKNVYGPPTSYFGSEGDYYRALFYQGSNMLVWTDSGDDKAEDYTVRNWGDFLHHVYRSVLFMAQFDVRVALTLGLLEYKREAEVHMYTWLHNRRNAVNYIAGLCRGMDLAAMNFSGLRNNLDISHDTRYVMWQYDYHMNCVIGIVKSKVFDLGFYSGMRVYHGGDRGTVEERNFWFLSVRANWEKYLEWESKMPWSAPFEIPSISSMVTNDRTMVRCGYNDEEKKLNFLVGLNNSSGQKAVYNFIVWEGNKSLEVKFLNPNCKCSVVWSHSLWKRYGVNLDMNLNDIFIGSEGLILDLFDDTGGNGKGKSNDRFDEIL